MRDENVQVSDVMRTDLHLVNGLASVVDAIGEMSRFGVSSLVIERRDVGDEYGVLTMRDIAWKVVGKSRPIDRTSVYEVMTKPALTLTPDMHVKYAIRLLSQFRISRALVVHEGKLVGLVTLRDMVIGYAGHPAIEN